MNNYYEVLGISPDASSEDVKRKYLFLVKAWHPDKFQDPTQKARAEERMKRINEAYTVLGNPERRAKYDWERKATAPPPAAKESQRQAGTTRPQSPVAGNTAGRKTANPVDGFRLLVVIFCLALVLWSAFRQSRRALEFSPSSDRAELQQQLLGVGQTVEAASRATQAAFEAAALQLSDTALVSTEEPTATETAPPQPSDTAPVSTEEPTATERATSRPSDTAPVSAEWQPTGTSDAGLPGPIASIPTVFFTISPDADGTLMAFIPAGKFWMGAAPEDPQANNTEKPGREVELSAYSIDMTEVTNARFARFVKRTGYRTDAEKLGSGWVLNQAKNNWEEVAGADWRHPHGPDSSIDGLNKHPVVQVSWNDASAYCQWRGARLPTEAEWEKAARGTDGRIYPWGNSPPDATLANFADLSLGAGWADLVVNDGFQFTAPVGSYGSGASPYGLFDMAGNVWEWVQDWYADDYSSVSSDVNPAGPDTGTARVLRGGCWGDPARNLRTSTRYRFEPDYRIDDFGFRCAR